MTTAAATGTGVALAERDDSELLALIRTPEAGDELRAAAREVIVTRYQSLVRGCVQRYRRGRPARCTRGDDLSTRCPARCDEHHITSRLSVSGRAHRTRP